MDKRSFTEEEAAQYIAMSRSFLRQDRMNGHRKNRTGGPPYIKIGRMVRYLKEDLDKWLENYRVSENGHCYLKNIENKMARPTL